MPEEKKESLCKLGHCVKKGSHYAGGNQTVYNKIANGICPICNGPLEKPQRG